MITIQVEGETHTVHFTRYQRPNNIAIQTYDEYGPYCRLSVNPTMTLEDDCVAIRDDIQGGARITRDVLIELDILRLTGKQIPIGYTTATLYTVCVPAEAM